MQTASFTVKKWEEKPVDNGFSNVKINSAQVTYDITGILEGKATIDYLLYYLDSDMSDAEKATSKIVGFLHFEGSYEGENGTFTAAENGIFDNGILDSPGEIIHSTGALSNLSGSYNYHFTGHTSELILDFDIK